MDMALLDALVCPLDHAPLVLTPRVAKGNFIESGTLACTGCGEVYAVEEGIPQMLSARLPGISRKLGEVQGWVDMARHEGWYQAQDELDLALPYVVEKLGWDREGARNWVATRNSFEYLLAHYVQPGMRVLEVGAGKTWSGHYFLERGCEYVGSDILADRWIGVGRSRFFVARFGQYNAVAADAEALPFRAGWFDLVFGIAALHHALDLDKMVSEMARVTRSGGYVAGLNEGVRALWANPNAAQQAFEKSYGINEHVHALGFYLRAFRRNRLRLVRVKRAVADDELIAPRLNQVLKMVRRVPRVGDRMATWLLLSLLHPVEGASFFASKGA